MCIKEQKKDTRLNFLIKIFIFFSLLFPMKYTTIVGAYYDEFTIANFFVGLIIVWSVFVYFKSWDLSYKKFIVYLILLLVIHDICSLYLYIVYSRWIWEAFNFTLAMLLFFVLLLYGEHLLVSREKIFTFVISCQLISTVIGIIIYFMGYVGVSLQNGIVTLKPHDPMFYEKRFNWLYPHKSQYCFILLLFIAFSVVYRRYYKSRRWFIVSNIIFVFGIIISHTYTAIFGAALVYCGAFIDYIKLHLKKINKKFFLLLPILGACLCGVIYLMSRERNIWTIGGRTYIWTAGIREIFKNPIGIGEAFGNTTFSVLGFSSGVNNCHNVFLNEMYRFSLPVGILFTIIFLSLMFYPIIKKFSFLSVGIIFGLLILLNMDYALMGGEYSITFFYFYMIFYFSNIDKSTYF